ncbi:hypothetical protein OUZ56_027321 [Daphnia magna]|uniref:Uncharacterized protein n=1 Tax=Daphnia magna TaxID=35525 RepID=A0ABQ9ZPU1_9CRUS|nr:hypothetical protein OUZ56_027321 [Daphnia magna]
MIYGNDESLYRVLNQRYKLSNLCWWPQVLRNHDRDKGNLSWTMNYYIATCLGFEPKAYSLPVQRSTIEL